MPVLISSCPHRWFRLCRIFQHAYSSSQSLLNLILCLLHQLSVFFAAHNRCRLSFAVSTWFLPVIWLTILVILFISVRLHGVVLAKCLEKTHWFVVFYVLFIDLIENLVRPFLTLLFLLLTYRLWYDIELAFATSGVFVPLGIDYIIEISQCHTLI